MMVGLLLKKLADAVQMLSKWRAPGETHLALSANPNPWAVVRSIEIQLNLRIEFSDLN